MRCDGYAPLTPIEWPERGNSIEGVEVFRLIRSYSPYNQLKSGAGHEVKSGRFDSLREVAEEYAFIMASMAFVE